ncbi:hypothetical protein EG329_005203 [Mollisiaceae sp. DMI_Dod_QoI]|nr:hypothetical protein EG329_005203 [Helotiales sp. DMI_Dod_QoI]
MATSPSDNISSKPSSIRAEHPHIGAIMDMIGLEKVKAQVLRIKAKVDTCRKQGTDLRQERLGLVLLGNPGTGKTTVARLYAKVLTSLKAVPGSGYAETTGARLVHGGVGAFKAHLRDLKATRGGVFFIDEAYQLTEPPSRRGNLVLDYLLHETEDLAGEVIFLFAGYKENMEKFFEHNPGFASRIPYTIHFEDYTDEELMMILQSRMQKFFNGDMRIRDGPDGLFMRIAIRRLGRGRGHPGFDNARAVENMFDQIRERQSERLTRERRGGMKVNYRFMTKEDLIGPDPSQAILKSAAWKELLQLTGLDSVKSSIRVMIERINANYLRELKEQPLIEISLNRVFLGGPGTGKTTVGKLYGCILADLGILSDGEVVVKNPADFIGKFRGHSEANTKEILASTVGKVLIIDEAYILNSEPGSAGGRTDSFRKAIIDTIVAKVQSVPDEDRCVLLLGYEEEMNEMFQSMNPGLNRRFRFDDPFRFEDFNDSQPRGSIIETQYPRTWCNRARNGLNFGNAGEVENLLSKAKENYEHRQSGLPFDQQSIDYIFEPEDFEPDYARIASANTSLQKLFEDVVGWHETSGHGPERSNPMNFIFKGPPGTGKTTTARKLGQVFYDLGFLSRVEVVECSATDFVSQFIGQTGPKVIKQLEKGLGKLLFIDEAHSLGRGSFGKEAINQLVDSMTKSKFAGKLVIVLAGYEKDMNDLLHVNDSTKASVVDLLMNSYFQKSNDPTVFTGAIIVRPNFEAHDGTVKPPSVGKRQGRSNYLLIVSHEIAIRCIRAMLSARRARDNPPPSHPAFNFTQVERMTNALHVPLVFTSNAGSNSKSTQPHQQNSSKPLSGASTWSFAKNFLNLRAEQSDSPKREGYSISTSESTSGMTPATLTGAPTSQQSSRQATASLSSAQLLSRTAQASVLQESVNPSPTDQPPPNIFRDPGVSNEDWQQLESDTKGIRAESKARDEGSGRSNESGRS